MGFRILGMKSSLRKLRGFALRRSEPKEKRQCWPPAKLDELVQAAQDIQGLKSCYDGLISAAAATANSAYEFSEALHEMGNCLLEKTALNADEDSRWVSLILGKTQFELERLVDNYRTHIIQTITTPSECLLKELQIVEDMKQQCDDKRDLYKFMLTAPRKKWRLGNPRSDVFTSQQLEAAREDFEEKANLFVFRLKSLKQGQSRSLFTQIARHHAAQLNFFRKGLKSLELIEPRVKFVAEQQHIDYQFNELEDDDMDYALDGDSYHDSSDDGELSFDYGLNELTDDALSMHRNSTMENVTRIQTELLHGNQRPSLSSQSAPIFTDKNSMFSEKIKKIPPPSTKKLHTYVLPTPVDVKNSTSNQLGNNTNGSLPLPAQLSYSSPLGSYNIQKYREKNSQSPTRSLKAQTRLADSSNVRNNPLSTHEAKKVKMYSFSGPITGKSWSSKPFFNSKVKDPTSHSNVSQTFSVRMSKSPPISTLMISELHELPRPPSSIAAHSAPLVSNGQEIQMTGKVFPLASETTLPLPAAPPVVLRSFSIPYRGQRTTIKTLNKLLETPRILDLSEEVDSPPLTPLSLVLFHDESTSSLKLQC